MKCKSPEEFQDFFVFGILQKRIFNSPLLPDGVPLLPDGVAMVRNGLPLIRNGVAMVRNGLPLIRNGVAMVRNGLPLIRNGVAMLRNGLPLVRNGVAMVRNGVEMVRNGSSCLVENDDRLPTAPDCSGNPFFFFFRRKKIGTESGEELDRWQKGDSPKIFQVLLMLQKKLAKQCLYFFYFCKRTKNTKPFLRYISFNWG